MTAHDRQHAAQLRNEIAAIEDVIASERAFIGTQIAHFEKQIVHGSGVKNCTEQGQVLAGVLAIKQFLPQREATLRGRIQERLTQIEQLQTTTT